MYQKPNYQTHRFAVFGMQLGLDDVVSVGCHHKAISGLIRGETCADLFAVLPCDVIYRKMAQ